LSRILSGGVGVGYRFKASKRSNCQNRDFRDERITGIFLKRKQCHCEEGTNVTGRGDEGIPTNAGQSPTGVKAISQTLRRGFATLGVR